MFEAFTFEAILNTMLSRVNNGLDKREGSIIYDALAPAAYELSQAYFNLNTFVDLVFCDTAVDEYLDRVVAAHGIARKLPTYSERIILTSGDVELGTRWGLKDTTYVLLELISNNIYRAKCEQPGQIGNIYSGTLDNIDNIMGITAVLSDIINHGIDIESDEALRERLKQYLANPVQNSNIAQYKQWALEYPGIGRVRVFPLWNGGNTVKIAITNGNYQPAEPKLIDDFQAYIDPGATGLGNGVAPIGSKVTIVSGTEKSISVTANVVLTDGYTEPEGTAKAISDYLASITFEKNSVNYMRIGSTLLDCASIADINDLKINSDSNDIPLLAYEIPVLSNISLAVIT